MSADHQDGAHDAQEFGQLSLSVAGSPLRTYWLTLSRTTIGRRATNTLVLDDLTVSGEHAVLLVGLQDVVIQDLGSRNGTLLNGRPVARALLSDGDCIDIGIYRLVYSQHRTVNLANEGQGAGTPQQAVATPFPQLSLGAPGLLQRLTPDLFRPEGAAPRQEPDGAAASGASSMSGNTAQPGDAVVPGAPASGAGSGPSFRPHAPSDSGASGTFSGFGPDMSVGPDMTLGAPAGFTEGFSRVPHLPPMPLGSTPPRPTPHGPSLLAPTALGSSHPGAYPGASLSSPLGPSTLPPAPPPMPRVRPALNNGAGHRGASLRFLGGHDAGRLLVIDRPIVSIRNGVGQVAVVSCREGGFFLTHVEGQAYPLVNGESIGLGAHPLRNHDLIELNGTIIQFSQCNPGAA
jgi:FOG: FHA domain